MTDAELVHSRLDALMVALRGLSDHPERVDVGPWRWALRGGSVATWRHIDDWHRTVTIRPVTPVAVVVEYPDGTADGSFTDERAAIDAALDWMDTNA